MKDRVIQRLVIKMGKQFGDDSVSLQIIVNVLKKHIKDGQDLCPQDIDLIEREIFQRLSNTSTNIALD